MSWRRADYSMNHGDAPESEEDEVSGWVPMGIDAPPCDGLIVVLPSRRHNTGDRMAPHECRSQRRWPDGET